MDGSMSGQAIYDNFARNSLAGLVDGANRTNRICTNYDTRVVDLKNVQINSYAAWLGAASESARLAGQPVITTQEVALPHIFSAALSMVRQAEVFESAKNSVVPIPPMPETPGFWDNVLDPAEANRRYEHQLLAFNAANDHNIAVMAAYEEATRQNQVMLTTIPGTPEPPAPTPPIDPIGPPADPQPWAPRPKPGERPPAGAGTPPGGQRTEPSSTQPDTRLPAPHNPPNPADLTHANLAQPVPTRIEPDVPTPKPAQPAPGTPSTPVGLAGGGYSSSGGPRGFGPGGRGAEHPGRGSGFGPHGTPPGPSGRGGSAVPPGRGGPGGQPPMGAGARARDEEDLERERPSFLVDPDPEETFGTDQVTAPPVIGG